MDEMIIRNDAFDSDLCGITIDSDGIARNRIGKAIDNDMLRKVGIAFPDCVNVSATRATYAMENDEVIKRFYTQRENIYSH